MSEVKLLGCPFCGGEPVIKSHRWAGNNEVKAHYVHCQKCNANSHGRNTVEKTVAFWNTRAQPKPEVAPDDEALLLRVVETSGNYVYATLREQGKAHSYRILRDEAEEALCRRFAELRATSLKYQLAFGDRDNDAHRLADRVAELRAELARWQSGELCTAKDAANNLHNLEVLGCANRRAEIAEARVAELEAAQIPTPPEGMHYELVRDGTTPRQRANHKRHARHIAILMNKGPK